MPCINRVKNCCMIVVHVEHCQQLQPLQEVLLLLLLLLRQSKHAGTPARAVA
jgi:hypothetical protein